MRLEGVVGEAEGDHSEANVGDSHPKEPLLRVRRIHWLHGVADDAPGMVAKVPHSLPPFAWMLSLFNTEKGVEDLEEKTSSRK